MHTLTLKVNQKNEHAMRSFLRKHCFDYELCRKSLSKFHVECMEKDFNMLESMEKFSKHKS